MRRAFSVASVPGPSAVLAALSVSGLPTDRFVFEGFLPRRASARNERLRRAARRVANARVFRGRAPRRRRRLVALVEHFGASRRAAVARELTKLHEQISTGYARRARARLGDDIPLKGEFVIVVAGAEDAAQPDEQRARSIFALLSEELSPNKAVAMTAAITGMPRNAVYRLTRLRE